jgi:hypothetical protein
MLLIFATLPFVLDGWSSKCSSDSLQQRCHIARSLARPSSKLSALMEQFFNLFKWCLRESLGICMFVYRRKVSQAFFCNASVARGWQMEQSGTARPNELKLRSACAQTQEVSIRFTKPTVLYWRRAISNIQLYIVYCVRCMVWGPGVSSSAHKRSIPNIATLRALLVLLEAMASRHVYVNSFVFVN